MRDTIEPVTHRDDFDRYLSAKRTVDDRALNQLVWRTLQRELAARPTAALNVVEIGAGIGTMIERMAAWGLFGARPTTYHAVDHRADNIQALKMRLSPQALPIQISTDVAELQEFVARQEQRGRFDLIVAHAFLDLIDLPTMLPAIRDLLRPGGLLYATINFDGATIFEPAIDPPLDQQIEELYHRTMDERLVDGSPSGDSRTGRHLFGRLQSAGMEILAAGSSDWVVFADRAGRYPDDEAFFLSYILGFVEGALRGHPALDGDTFARWLTIRRRQLAAGELVYLAHQLDFLARLPE